MKRQAETGRTEAFSDAVFAIVLTAAAQSGLSPRPRGGRGAALLCVTWRAFFWYLSRHPELHEHDVDPAFFARDSARTWAGVALHATAGAVGYRVAPLAALAIFFVLPVFYGLTSRGLDNAPVFGRRPHR
jgi:hypothetical protein